MISGYSSRNKVTPKNGLINLKDNHQPGTGPYNCSTIAQKAEQDECFSLDNIMIPCLKSKLSSQLTNSLKDIFFSD